MPRAAPAERGLTVAMTGPTRTLGFGLVPLLQGDDRIGRIIGIARRARERRTMNGVPMAPARTPLATVVAALAGRVTGTGPQRMFTTLAGNRRLFRR